MNNIPPEILQFLLGLLIAVVGWNVKKIDNRVEDMQSVLRRNTNRLVRIETHLEIEDRRDDND